MGAARVSGATIAISIEKAHFHSLERHPHHCDTELRALGAAFPRSEALHGYGRLFEALKGPNGRKPKCAGKSQELKVMMSQSACRLIRSA